MKINIFYLFLTVGTDGIQLRQVSVPSVIQAGEGASLLCDVDMQNERLYSVKWYKDEETEFFRYVPRESPPLIVYNLPGINVNVSPIHHTLFFCHVRDWVAFHYLSHLINLNQSFQHPTDDDTYHKYKTIIRENDRRIQVTTSLLGAKKKLGFDKYIYIATVHSCNIL